MKMSNTGVLQISLLCILVVSSSIEEPNFNNIYVNPDAGRDTEGCRTSNSSRSPCQTLNFAFKHRANFTQYILQPNSTNKLNESVATFMNLHMLGISGGGAGSVIVCDGEETGLAFVSVSNISFTNVTFLYCSATRNSTSKKFEDSGFKLYKFKVSLYFYLCENVLMTRVNVSSSPSAAGVVMYDTVGENVIQESIFTNNSVLHSGTECGGGGFAVEFSYCIPGDDQCSDSKNYTSNIGAYYSFLGCNFSHNSASNNGIGKNSTYIVPYQSNHQAFGRGGGLSIFVNGAAAQNTIHISRCLFEGNSAQWGGGLFLEFHDQTSNNTVHVSNCTFVGNWCNYTLDMGTGGGGARIGHYVYNYYHWNTNEGNLIEILDTNFSMNLAMYGGGLSISPALQNTALGKEAFFKLVRLTFDKNHGKFGAALHIRLFRLILQGIPIFLTIKDCSFLSNRVHYAEVLNKSHGPYTIGVGAVYINEVPVIFQGKAAFYNNSATALAVVGSPVDFTETQALFLKNDGYRGGAIALLGSTYILIDNKTELLFIDNMAVDKGGAIYNRYIEMDDMVTNSNCFIRHVNPFIGPDQWKAVFVFTNNVDLNGHHNNSIHTSSILPCASAGGNGFAKNRSRIFCWEGWSYYNQANLSIIDCQSQISSGVGHISLENSRFRMQAVPGQQFTLPFRVSDDNWNDITQTTAFSAISNVSQSEYLWGGNAATLTGEQGTFIDLAFQTLGDRIWHMEYVAELLLCSPGLKPTNTSCKCTNTYNGAVLCDPDTLNATIIDHHWMGKIEGQIDHLVGGCPPGYCRAVATSLIKLPNSTKDLSRYICSDNREGVLCGECVKGHGPAVNSYAFDCVNCTDINLAANIARYVGSVYVPLAALFAALIVFDIRLTTGPANAFIIYCQVVSSTFSLNADGQLNKLAVGEHPYEALLQSYKFIYGVFNLEFIENLLPPFCLSQNFNTLSVLLLDYGVAFFPLVMIVIVVVCLKLMECCPRSCCPVNRLSARCRLWNRSIKEALLPAFAVFILLSYTKLSLTSSYLVGSWNLIDENGKKIYPARVYYAGQLVVSAPKYIHAYLVPALFIFITFVGFTPLLLLFYPLKAIELCLSRIHFLWRFYPIDKVNFFLDTFQGCYRNNMRFFPGIYFLFRLAINFVYLFTRSWVQQFMGQQIACVIMITLIAVFRPYNKENNLFNYVDTLIFADLAVLNALSQYMYTSSRNGLPPSLSTFVLQYILVFLPLVYMLMYILWYVLVGRNKGARKNLYSKFKLCLMRLRLFKPLSNDFRNSYNSDVITRTDYSVPDSGTQDNDDNDDDDDDDGALFTRAEATNQYRGRGSRAVEDNKDARETDLLCMARDSSSNYSAGYGTMGSSSNPSDVTPDLTHDHKDL
jgi:hypothetical protein